MKTATVEQVPQRWPEILHWVTSDEEIQIIESGRVVARIVPPLTMGMPLLTS
jgi:antitoxin (DNA-binding transcriptional repressor) of toxin-antitoxin stability system